MNRLKTKNITYIFGSGRKEKLLSNEEFPKEFFYSYFDIADKVLELDFIEFNDKNNNKMYIFVDKVLRKISKLSFFTNSITSRSNFKQIRKSDIIVATNDRIGLSILPMLLLVKIFKKIDVYVFVMGLFSNQSNKKYIQFMQRSILILFSRLTTQFIFLGNPEKEKAELSFPNYKNKFSFIPFSIDTDFWSGNKDIDFDNKTGILFVGNDSFRDYRFVTQLASEMQEYEFTFITSQINKDQVISNNVKLVNGKWNKSLLTDTELKNIYESSRLTILPLKETIQPSGQSVALQSMNVGTPVLITKTSGFWDKKSYENYKNIVFIANNDINTWREAIESTYNNTKCLEKLSAFGMTTIKNNYTLKYFNDKFINILNN